MTRKHYLWAAAGTTAVAILVFSGLVMGGVLAARLILGSFWTAATVAWISCYLHCRRTERLGQLAPAPVPTRKR